jgi:hypothetical protein
MRIHNPFVTGSLTVSGSKGVDFSDATGGVSGSFRPSDIKTALPANTVSGSSQLATDISGSFTPISSSLSTRTTTLEAASSSLETNKASKGFSIAMSVAL